MEKLTSYQKKRLWLRIISNMVSDWESHAEWATKQFGVHITDEECSMFYMERLTAEPVVV